METTAAFQGLVCTQCETPTDPGPARCPECQGLLVGAYDVPSVDPGDVPARSGLGRWDPFLPFPAERLVSLDEGQAPVLDVPGLAAELDVATVGVLDGGRNPTGSLADRKLSLAVSAARQTGAERVATPATGNGAQSNAAYAARAGLDSTGFVPSRCPFLNKAMVNVHGGDMRVVEGRYADAVDAFREAASDWTALAPGDPFRVEGAKTVAFDLLAALDWDAPDAVVHPTGHGETLVGLERGFAAAVESGLTETVPRLYAAQPESCAPVATAWAADVPEPTPVEHPDTVVGPLEVADPAAGEAALDAIERTGGGAVAVEDDEALRGAVDCCELGPEVGATGGTGVAGARVLATQDAFDPSDDLVVVNPVAGSKEADLLRSHLMSRGL